jgi:hypothetical protein
MPIRTFGPPGRALSLGLVIAAGSALAGSQVTPDLASSDFPSAMATAAARMHADMAVGFTHDADRDFARMMIPHHQGAIDMALAELRYGRDARLRRLAQEIVVVQQQEIALMRHILDDASAPRPAAPSNPQAHHPEN